MRCGKCLEEFVPTQLIGGELLLGDTRIIFQGKEMHEGCFRSLNIIWWDESTYPTKEAQEVIAELDVVLVNQI